MLVVYLVGVDRVPVDFRKGIVRRTSKHVPAIGTSGGVHWHGYLLARISVTLTVAMLFPYMRPVVVKLELGS